MAAARRQIARFEENANSYMAEEMASADTFFIVKGAYERLVERFKKKPANCAEDVDSEENCHDLMARCSFKHDQKHKVNAEAVQAEAQYKLPKLELTKFDLNPRTYIAFWAQFKVIDCNKNIRIEEKFQYLLNTLVAGSRARKIVESYPPSGENYSKVLVALKTRFGRDSAIIEVYSRDLINLVVNKGNKNLSQLYDSISSKIRALETLGVTTDNVSAVLYPLVQSTLPDEVAKLWERRRRHMDGELDEGSITSANPLNDLLVFLEEEVLAEEALILTRNVTTVVKNKEQQVPTAAALLTAPGSTFRPPHCCFCKENHHSFECKKDVSYNDRIDAVKRAGRCLRCLRHGHRVRDCKCKVSCTKCSSSDHITNMHNDSKPTTSLYAGNTTNTVYLKTVIVQHKNRKIRVLFDDGSSRSYIKNSLAEELDLEPSGSEDIFHTLFGGVETPNEKCNIFDIKLKGDKFEPTISCLGKNKICCSIPRIHDQTLIEKLRRKGIYLTDTGPGEPEIEILIGAQDIGHLTTQDLVCLDNGIAALRTKLGWTVVGSTAAKPLRRGETSLFISTNFWDLETLGIENPTKCFEIDDASIQFKNSIHLNSEGRYEVNLLWKAGHPQLASNKNIAESRLRTVTARLQKNFKDYDTVFSNWESVGIIEKVDDTVLDLRKIHYLPHRPVFKPLSSTPIRPVFDASCKARGNVSLNDCLLIGPNLIQEIPKMLTKFRLGKIGVSADIKGAFLQISLHEKDRDCLRFLWWDKDDPNKIIIYRHTRVVFGVSSSPYLLNATLAYHLQNINEPEYTDTIKKMTGSFYVDDLLTSVDTREELEKFIKEAAEVLATRHFELTKWAYTGQMGIKHILGLNWDLCGDKMFCRLPKLDDESKLTKRSLLSVVSRVYDPIGFLSPALLVPKILIQEAWRMNAEWDDELSVEIAEKFMKWKRSWNELENLRVPRELHCELSDPKENCCELHVFADGSGSAYACCIYLRCVRNDNVKIRFVASKARVVPKEGMSIPRIELMGTLIAARLVNALGFHKNIPVTYYTDSTVALTWIVKSIPWKTWIGNRVEEIRRLSSPSQWLHIDGKHNPADLPSRGCDFGLMKKSRWLSGPHWLSQPRNTWPSTKLLEFASHAMDEAKPVESLLVVERIPFSPIILRYFSNYKKLWRMMAWITRFINNCKKLKENRQFGSLTAEELKKGEIFIFRVIQSEWHDKDKHKNLNLFTDDDDIVRSKTRLDFLTCSESFKYPVVLPSHPLVERLIEFYHISNAHASASVLLNILREKMWLIKKRQVVKKIINTCLRCKRFSVKNIETPVAPLPSERVEKCVVFQNVGVDLGGPLILKGGSKAWFVLFTCAVYRAVHLELVSNLSTELFIAALRRFFARRGKCAVLWSDQGSNFCGTSNLLDKIDWSKIVEECVTQRIIWKFNPPAAPWWGGFWERLVGLVKNALKRTLGMASLSYEEMLTVLADCEVLINRRPLTYMSNDISDIEPITPWNFLCENRDPDFNDLDEVENIAPHSLIKRVLYVRNIRNNLRNRFQNEYLGALASRAKQTRGELKVGDIVLVGSDQKKRLFWPLARVLELIPGRDGQCRVARLKLQGGELFRAVQRIYPLEICSDVVWTVPQLDDVLTPVPNNDSVSDCESENLEDPVVSTRLGRLVKKPSKMNL